MARSDNLPEDPVKLKAWIYRHTKTFPAPNGLEKPCRRYCKLDGWPYERPRQLCWHGIRTSAARVVFELTNDVVIGDGQVVRHRCDVSDCVEPTHLELGTHSDNTMDAVKRGRWRQGTKTKADGRTVCQGQRQVQQNPNAVPQIDERLRSGEPNPEVRPGGKAQHHKRPLLLMDVLTILRAGHASNISELPRVQRDLAQRFARTPTTIRHIWIGKIFSDVCPEIPRLTLTGHGRSLIDVHELARIRATWDAYPELQAGRTEFLKALAEYVGMDVPPVKALLTGRFRTEEPIQDVAPIPLTELGFLPYPLPEGSPRKGLLRPEHVRDIVVRYNGGGTLKEIADAYRRSVSTISEIVCRKTWNHVTRELEIREGPTGPKRPK